MRLRPDVVWNTQAAINATNHFLSKFPEAGIFLCTDDGAIDKPSGKLHHEGVGHTFYKLYGERLFISPPRSLDRGVSVSTQDALVDLWLLRSTKMIVGTKGSSFSYLSAFGREVEYKWVSGKTPAYSVIHWITLLTGVHWLVRILYRSIHGHYRPFPVSWRRLIKALDIKLRTTRK